MAEQAIIDEHISWVHEKNRAVDLGKANYEVNCDIEIDRLESAYPELIGNNCSCAEFTGCTG